jgi:putative NADH-flavin reductase
MKKLLLFGATGPSGQVLLRQALEAGHSVTAVVRNPDAFQQSHENLELVKGDVLVSSSFQSAVAGKDAVLSTLGVGSSMKATTVYSEGGKNIVEAMRAASVKKFICVTSGGMEEDDPSLGFAYKYIFKPLFSKPYGDMKVLETYLRTVQDMDWVIVRPAQLTDTPRTGVYRISPRFAPEGGVKISRADLADFMLKQIDSNEWVHKTPTLTY